jgi:DNA repair protein RadA/Sms
MPPKSKSRNIFVCQQCGSEQPKWTGRCPDCGAWNSFSEQVVTTSPSISAAARADGGTGNRPVPLPQVQSGNFKRIEVPGEEFNRVLGGGIVPGSLVLIGGDPGIGKCLVGDSRVFDPETGDYLPITEWAKRPRRVLAAQEQSLTLGPADVAAFHERGVKPIVEVTTRLGRKLRCTPEHPVLTVEGWQPVGGLQPGVRIAAPRSLPYFGNEPLDEAAVKLMAYVLSDGSAQSAVSVTSCLPEVERDLEEMAVSFNMRLVRYPKRGNAATQYRFYNDKQQRTTNREKVAEALQAAKERAGISWQTWSRLANVEYGMLHVWRKAESVPSASQLRRLADAVGVSVETLQPEARHLAEMRTPIARLLDEVGLRFSKARTKAVPECVFRLPRQQLALFLKVLFTCDGSVYVNGRGTPGVSYSTISRRLAEDVQHLLLRFGLVATLRTKNGRVNGQPYTAHEVVLLGVTEVKRFLSSIGIMGRTEALARIASIEEPRGPSTHRDTIPTGASFWSHLSTAMGDVNFAEATRRAGTKIMHRRPERPLCRSTVQSIVGAFPEPRLEALAYGDVYWDEIASIVPAGEAPVYDLSVPGRENFVANDLIVHNSTLLLQVSAEHALWADKPVLYVSGEESPQQIKLRASRLDLNPERLFLLAENNLDAVLAQIETMQPGLVVIDSIQTVYLSDLTSAAGTVSQVRECTSRLMHLAKMRDIPMFLVGHVTKEGAIAGPRVLEHIVDAVLYLEGDRFHQYRLLRGVKNRFGSTNEVGVFEMGNEGMVEVTNPSAAFLAERNSGTPGTAIAVTLEGTRPILVEVQALTSSTSSGLPRRTSNGIDLNRLLLLAAVLSKRVGLGLSNQDIYANVVGGLKISEPAVDLAVAAAIASSYRDTQVDPEAVLIGEVGLSGELRSVGQLERRLSEAAKLGFTRAIYPPTARKPKLPSGLQGISVATLQEAVAAALVK